MTHEIGTNNNLHTGYQQPVNKYAAGDNIGSWSFNGVWRAIRFLGEAALWGCTSSSLKTKYANRMPSSFSRRQSELRIPKRIREEVSYLDKPKPCIRRNFVKLGFKIQFSSPFRGYCKPLLGVSDLQRKIDNTYDDVLGDIYNYEIEQTDGTFGRLSRDFIFNFMISQSRKRGEHFGPVKIWLEGKVAASDSKEIWKENLSEAKNKIRHAMIAAKHDIRSELDSSSILELRTSVSPLEYSEFVKENQSYTSKFRLRLKLEQKFEQKLQHYLGEGSC